MTARGTVFVGMSGGVDSSVSAYLLKKAGYTVVGVFIKVWQPEFLRCHWEEERLDAMRVCAHLEIPFLTCDAEAAYKKEVADYFIEEYRKGRTPNPDVMCNTYIKFGTFLRFAQQHGADYIATGHYAQITREGEVHSLLRGADTDKDQSYFLWNVPHELLGHVLFPVGHLTKPEVRKIAERAGIPTASKKDSQGICFLGHVDIHEFLSHFMELSEGEVVTEEGTVVGTHKGVELYTLGQRHGFVIHHEGTESRPYFVVARDLTKNRLVVSHEKRIEVPQKDEVLLHTPNLHAPLREGERVQFVSRYRGEAIPAFITKVGDTTLALTPQAPFERTSAGQSVVLYRDDVLLGGGIME